MLDFSKILLQKSSFSPSFCSRFHIILYVRLMKMNFNSSWAVIRRFYAFPIRKYSP